MGYYVCRRVFPFNFTEVAEHVKSISLGPSRVVLFCVYFTILEFSEMYIDSFWKRKVNYVYEQPWYICIKVNIMGFFLSLFESAFILNTHNIHLYNPLHIKYPKRLIEGGVPHDFSMSYVKK